ncbi:hypothetical protein D3C75_1055500 [compost metagenome]
MVRVEDVDGGRRVVERVPVEDARVQILIVDPEQQVVLGRPRHHLARQLVVDDKAL